ncbi:hypothetical protein ABH920_006596 [Catenulispora sp. EB89]|uniref:hypothetical protein n=1 Tax=Catenulispora sp. EB89 TaxID=3156257 RepID=UPI003511BA08
MHSDDLRDFYAESAHRWKVANREFQKRTHGWHFTLAPAAHEWAQAHAASDRWHSSGTTLIELADAAGMIHKPEPGRIAAAYSHRDSRTEMTTEEGFGFWPTAAEALVVHAGHAIPLAALEPPATRGDGTAPLALLRLVVDSFATVSVFSDPPGARRG